MYVEVLNDANVTVTLPDGSQRTFTGTTTGFDVASNIGPGLAKAALAVKVNGDMWDLMRPLPGDCDLAIVTARDEDGLELLRHDCAHVMAQAVQELFPGTQVTIGPVIDDGFFYDFAREKPFTEEDLPVIEQRMKEIVARDLPIEREVWDRNEAIKHFKSIGEHYKAEIISDLPEEETITIYRQGDWYDLCRGPHLPSTGKLGTHFKLMKVSGAYWRGDSKNAMLTRIYGTAWADKKDLKAYLVRLEEAAKRDHRKLGKEMDLFHFQEEAIGSVFWHPKGWTIFNTLIDYMRDRQSRAGYVEINTPDIMDRSLWEKSGHWGKFGENMFTTEPREDRTFALKPMNCPGGVQVYKQGIKSYRDLPLRMGEFGKVHRFEPSGALHGLMRVRAFTQDDAHIFCTEDQITDESKTVCDLILDIYREFGFDDVRIKFSDRPEKRIGSDDIWDKSEAALMAAVKATGLEFTINKGEGAFYGPKLEFVLRDAIGRDWQCGTLQVDLNLPERLGAFYIGPDGDKRPPVMLHRALFGSLERFTGILLEHYAGKLPLWLAPVQAVVATITSEANAYGEELLKKLQAAGIRAELDTRNEKINYKVREHSVAKVQNLLVVGAREAEEGTVSLRQLGSQHQKVLPFDDVFATLKEEATLPSRR